VDLEDEKYTNSQHCLFVRCKLNFQDFDDEHDDNMDVNNDKGANSEGYFNWNLDSKSDYNLDNYKFTYINDF